MFFLEENSFPDDLSFLSTSPSVSLGKMDEEARREYWACLALRHCSGIGIRTRTKLLNRYGSAFAALQNMRDWEKNGLPARLRQEMATERWRPEAKREWLQAGESGAGILLWNNVAFPQKLRELPDCPIFLYYSGDSELLQGPCVGIVGSRDAMPRSLEVAFSLAQSLSKCGITVVSGMACGIDCQGHLGALSQIGKSIGVLGTGISVEYPRANKKLFERMREEGLLLSEFPPGTPPISRNFPVRNRIISGLSLGIVVVEAAAKSGSLITARLALEQNREVFAVPGAALDSGSRGCQNLIRQGAHVVFNVDDILQDLAGVLKPFGLKMPEEKTVRVVQMASEFSVGQKEVRTESGNIENARASENFEGKEAVEKIDKGDLARDIKDLLHRNGRMQMDDMAMELDISPGELSSSLVMMEMLGGVKRSDGGWYEAVK